MDEYCRDCICTKCFNNGDEETSPCSKELLNIMNGCMWCRMEDSDCKKKTCNGLKLKGE